jgi:hypothetical protein
MLNGSEPRISLNQSTKYESAQGFQFGFQSASILISGFEFLLAPNLIFKSIMLDPTI